MVSTLHGKTPCLSLFETVFDGQSPTSLRLHRPIHISVGHIARPWFTCCTSLALRASHDGWKDWSWGFALDPITVLTLLILTLRTLQARVDPDRGKRRKHFGNLPCPAVSPLPPCHFFHAFDVSRLSSPSYLLKTSNRWLMFHRGLDAPPPLPLTSDRIITHRRQYTRLHFLGNSSWVRRRLDTIRRMVAMGELRCSSPISPSADQHQM